jgi:hypothetical protein
LIAVGDNGVAFRWKDYRADGRERQKVMTLATSEFIREDDKKRFLVLWRTKPRFDLRKRRKSKAAQDRQQFIP